MPEAAEGNELLAAYRKVLDGENTVEITDRSYRFRTYKSCFVGSELVDKLIDQELATSREDAVTRFGEPFLREGIIRHVTKDHDFKDGYFFYEKSPSIGANPEFFLLGSGSDQTSGKPNHPAAESLEPYEDKYNKALGANVHPQDYKNPEPRDMYTMVVIGAGAAGLVTAAGGAGVGAKVAIVEKGLMGGDCLNTGCVPSKALIRSARAVHAARVEGKEFGLTGGEGCGVDFGVVMERLRRIRAEISANDSVKRFTRDVGVDVFMGEAKFTGPNTVSVNGKDLKFRKACIAVGSSAVALPIKGLDTSGYYTNETIFTLTSLPKSMVIIGAGPIGCEMAQSFARFGTKVTLLEVAPQILIREDPDAAAVIHDQLVADGIDVVTSCKISEISGKTPAAIVKYTVGDESTESKQCECEALLLGVGRAVNLEPLGLETVGVEYSKSGVTVNDYLQTTNPDIYAAGDCATALKFTHHADFMARAVIRNALFPLGSKVKGLLLPWCTYTEPEIAHVGLYAKDAEEKGIEIDTYTRELKDVDRAILEGDIAGFVKIHVAKGGDKILGATIVSNDAGNLISEISVAMRSNMGLGTLASVIHPYPTVAEAIRQTGDAYRRTKLSPTTKKLLNFVMPSA
eukprot:Clim_evm5s232 gene=Clim_evmTU5s232